MSEAVATIEETDLGIACPLCSRLVRGESVECNSVHAEVLLSWVWSSKDEYESWYKSSEYHDEQFRANKGASCSELYHECVDVAEIRFRQIAAALNVKSVTTLMDVGAGNGAFVDVARGNGIRAYGIDPHSLREDLQNGSWEDVDRRFDVITMFDVIEHLLHPYKALSHLRDCLTENGVIVIETPEYNAPNKQWKRHIKPSEHVVLYSREGAEFLYDMAGLTVIGFGRPLRATLGKMSHMLQRKEP